MQELLHNTRKFTGTVKCMDPQTDIYMIFLLCHLRLGIFSYHHIVAIYTNCSRTVTEAAPENMHFFITKQ